MNNKFVAGEFQTADFWIFRSRIKLYHYWKNQKQVTMIIEYGISGFGVFKAGVKN